jgi:ankyrin repeat protein
MRNPDGNQSGLYKKILFIGFILFFAAFANAAERLEQVDALIIAAGKGDLNKIIQLLNQGVDINSQEGNDTSALISAAQEGRFEAVQLLLEQGADVNSSNISSNTALISAAGRGDLETVKLLLSYRADLNPKNFLGNTALITASEEGHMEIVNLLLDYGADIRTVNKKGFSAFASAAVNGHLDIATRLYHAYKTSPPGKDDINKAFFIACYKERNMKALKYLLDLGADINYSDESGETALLAVSFRGYTENVTFLLANGADINHTDQAGNTALMWAAQYGKMDVARVLLEHKADKELKNLKGNTALMLIKDQKILDLFFEYGAEKPETLDLDKFELKYALPYDKRLVEGLRLALLHHFQLFPARSKGQTAVEVKTSQVDLTHYKVTYSLSIAGKTESYELILSNQGGAIDENLEKLEEVTRTFSKRTGVNIKAGTKGNEKDDRLQEEISELVSHYDYIDLFKALQIIDHHVSTGVSGPVLLFRASEIYSLLGFLKNRNDNRDLSDLFASQAVSNYLLANLGEVEDSDSSFYKGLLLLSLDYPAAADRIFNKERPIERLMSAFIEYDFETMASFSRHPLINKRLLNYLTARAYNSSDQNNVAWQYYEKLMFDYPDFLLAKEYVVDHGSLGMSRRYIMTYIEELLEKHLHIIGEFLKTDPYERNRELELDVRKEITEGTRLSKWLKIHNALVNRSNEMSKTCTLLDAELLSRFMMEDMSNALLIHFDIEEHRLGRMAQATEISEMVKAAYPDSTISRVLDLKIHQRSPKMYSIILETPIDKADRMLLRTLIDVNEQRHDLNIRCLNRYIINENPDSIGLHRLYEYYQKLYYRPFAMSALKNALITDPYNYIFYKEILDREGGEDVIKNGRDNIGHLYGFLTTAAAWHHKNGNNADAVSYYDQAIQKSPGQKTAYSELGEIYLEEKRYDDAIKTWSEYLKYDNTSLSAVSIKNAVGMAWLEMGDIDKAYNIFMESKDSAQAGALLGFAEVSEKLGKTLQAEKYYQKAAKRYPEGTCPARLGIFYLRQNNPEMAYQVFREYKRFNPFYYYFYDLVDYAIEAQEPTKALQTIVAVEKGTRVQRDYCSFVLADIFASKKKFEEASRLVKGYAGSSGNATFACRYWDFSVEGDNNQLDMIFADLLKRCAHRDSALIEFGSHLIETGFYDEGLTVLNEIFVNKDKGLKKTLEEALSAMALAWNLGSREPRMKTEIIRRIGEVGGDEWFNSRIMFLLGEMSEGKIMALADTPRKRAHIFYYLGAINDHAGKRDIALKNLLMCLETMESGNKEFENAYHIAQKLAG